VEGTTLGILLREKSRHQAAHASTFASRDYCMGGISPCGQLRSAGSRAPHFLQPVYHSGPEIARGVRFVSRTPPENCHVFWHVFENMSV